MSAPFQPGDVVVCVDATDCPIYPGSNGGIALNALYRVEAVRACLDYAGRPVASVQVDRHNPVHPVTGQLGFHNSVRFRKLAEQSDFDFREQLRKLPVKQPVSA